MKQKYRFYCEDFHGNISVVVSDDMKDIIQKHSNADKRKFRFVSAVICYSDD